MSSNPNLPKYFSDTQTSFMRRAEILDPSHAHRWVNVNAANQIDQASKEWEPVEDRQELIRLGLGALIVANGRARYMDVELWRMPIEKAKAIRQHMREKTAERSTSVKADLESLAADTIGRSRGKVVPTVSAGYADSQDVLTKEPITLPPTGSKAAPSGKK